MTQAPTADLPVPLVPPEVDLTDFAYLPFYMDRFRKSEAWVLGTAAEKNAMIELIAEAWHQHPAGSLPDHDVMLARLGGYGVAVRSWKRVRAGALRGWIKCADGRLYHPDLAEVVLKSWYEKCLFRWGQECDRLRYENKKAAKAGRAELPLPPKPVLLRVPPIAGGNAGTAGIPTDERSGAGPAAGLAVRPPAETPAAAGGAPLVGAGRTPAVDGGILPENGPKGEGKGEGEGEGKDLSPSSPHDAGLAGLWAAFWAAYPSRGLNTNPELPAKALFEQAVAGGVDPEELVAGARGYAEAMRKAGKAGTEMVLQAKSFLKQGAWRQYLPVPLTAAGAGDAGADGGMLVKVSSGVDPEPWRSALEQAAAIDLPLTRSWLVPLEFTGTALVAPSRFHADKLRQDPQLRSVLDAIGFGDAEISVQGQDVPAGTARPTAAGPPGPADGAVQPSLTLPIAGGAAAVDGAAGARPREVAA